MRENKLIQLYITNMCNSHCKTCSIWRNVERQELNIAIDKVFVAFPYADYVIGGGEAILHRYIEKILSLLHHRRINYTLLSNCIQSKRLCDLIERYHVPAVTISFDGYRHDEIRGSVDNMSKIIGFKRWCDDNNVKMKISYTYSKYNEDCFEEDMYFIKKVLGLNEVYFCIAQDMDLLMTVEADESFEASNFEQILKCDMIPIKDRNHIKGMIPGVVRRICSSQNNVHTIYSNGDIVRCQSFKSKEVLGNIKRMSVQEIRNTLNFVENERCQFDTECNLLCQRRYDQ